MNEELNKKVQAMRAGGKILHDILYTTKEIIKPGVNVLDIESFVDDLFVKNGVTPSFKGYQGFPSSLCICVNDEVVHGIPKSRVLEEGDIVTLDCGVEFEGYHTDSAITVFVGPKEAMDTNILYLMEVTEGALKKALKVARAGIRVGEVSNAIGKYITQRGLTPVENLGGHGISRTIHEDPYIPNEGPKNYGPILEEGMTVAIEPIVCTGGGAIEVGDDDWTIYTKDGSISAQFEHTILITKNGNEILT